MSDRMDELDELIKAGWGNTPQPKIPDNWRELNAEAYGTIQQLNFEAYAPQSVLVELLEREARTETRGRAPHRRFFNRPSIQRRADWLRGRARSICK